MTKNIYGISDKTTDCPFYIDFFEKEKDAIKALEKQIDYARMEFGLEDLYISGYKVYQKRKVIFSIDKFRLK